MKATLQGLLVQQVVDRLKSLGAGQVGQIEGIEERVTFPLPKGLVTA